MTIQLTRSAIARPGYDCIFTHASWGLRATEAWEEIGGRKQFDQTESFWRGFEGLFFRIVAERSIELEAA